jgi:hypothetical protein
LDPTSKLVQPQPALFVKGELMQPRGYGIADHIETRTHHMDIIQIDMVDIHSEG